MNWVNLATQSTAIPPQIDQTQPPTPALLLKYGWRIPDPTEPPLAEGYERLARWYVQDPARPDYAILAVTDGNIAERIAREAAAEAVRKNTPIVHDQPQEMPALVLTSVPDGIGIGLVPDNEGNVVSFVYHASPIPTPEEIAIRKAEAVSNQAQHKNRIAAIKTDLDDAVAAIDLLDAAAIDPAAFTGAQKTTVQAMKAYVTGLKVAVKNAVQAVEKVRKEIK